MVGKKKKIPYFLQIGGCRNCKVHQEYITQTGTLYEEGHPLHAKCVHMGCDKYGYSMAEPYITPQEYLRIAGELNSGTALNMAKKIIARFFDFYDTKGNLLPWVTEAISREETEKPAHVKVAPPITK
jgi:hypothetical protein